MREVPKRFTGARLRLARQRCGRSQVDLGALVNVSHAFIGYLEAGHKSPSGLLLEALGQALEVEKGFFALPVPEEFRDEECHFRRRQSTPVGVRTQVLAHATLFGEFVECLENFLVLPPQQVPTIRASTVEQIERAADHCRHQYGLGDDLPVTNMARVLERAGVPITRFEGLSDKVDAFSRFGQRSLVVLNDKTASRSRWDMAHELGHLVMQLGLLVMRQTLNSKLTDSPLHSYSLGAPSCRSFKCPVIGLGSHYFALRIVGTSAWAPSSGGHSTSVSSTLSGIVKPTKALVPRVGSEMSPANFLRMSLSWCESRLRLCLRLVWKCEMSSESWGGSHRYLQRSLVRRCQRIRNEKATE